MARQNVTAFGAGGESLLQEPPAVQATGTIALTGVPDNGGTITFPARHAHAETIFEFDAGDIASGGALSLTDNPSDGETLEFYGSTFEFDDGVAATGSVALGTQPTDGETVTVDGTVFEFDDDVSITGDVTVTIGVDVAATLAALVTAFNTEFSGTYTMAGDGTITADAVGAAGNAVITEAGADITVTSLTGGVDAGDAITAGNVGVVIGADADATMVNLIAAFNTELTGLFTATASTPADHECSIAADVIGDYGNVTPVASDDIAVTALTGGADLGEGVTAGNIAVLIGASAAASANNLFLAILAADIGLAASLSSATITLTDEAGGTGGNITTTEVCANLTVTGLAGGLDAISSREIFAGQGGYVASEMTSVAVDLNASASAQQLVAAPATGHEYWIYGYELHANIAGSYQFLSAANAKTGIMPVGANGGVARDAEHPIFKIAAGEAFNIKSVTCAADGIVTYRDVTL